MKLESVISRILEFGNSEFYHSPTATQKMLSDKEVTGLKKDLDAAEQKCTDLKTGLARVGELTECTAVLTTALRKAEDHWSTLDAKRKWHEAFIAEKETRIKENLMIYRQLKVGDTVEVL